MSAKRKTEALLELLADALTDRIKSGEATAADFNVIRQFLKDNGVNAIPTESNGIGQLVKELPFQSAEAIAEEENLH